MPTFHTAMSQTSSLTFHTAMSQTSNLTFHTVMSHTSRITFCTAMSHTSSPTFHTAMSHTSSLTFHTAMSDASSLTKSDTNIVCRWLRTVGIVPSSLHCWRMELTPTLRYTVTCLFSLCKHQSKCDGNPTGCQWTECCAHGCS